MQARDRDSLSHGAPSSLSQSAPGVAVGGSSQAPARDAATVVQPSSLPQLPADRAVALDDISRAALEHLAQPDLLRQLLGRLRHMMDADNAAILLINCDDPTILTIYSVEGPEAAVAEQVRVSVGEGVAGTIVATQAPLLIDDLRMVSVANPFLREHLRSLVGVPLMVHGQAIGALHVDSIRVGHFRTDDVPFVQAVAERIALAVDHARLYHQAQVARQEAEAHSRQLAAIFAAMADGIFVMDRDGRVLHMNAAARELLGLSQGDEYYGRALGARVVRSEVFDTQGHPMPVEQWPTTRILAGEVLIGSDAADIVVHTPGGRVVELSITGAPIRDERGTVVASVNICRDVTERRQLERRTRKTLDALLQMAQLLVALPANLPTEVPAKPAAAFGALDVARPVSAPEVGAEPGARAEALVGGTEPQLAHHLAVLARDVLGCVRVSITAVEPETERLRAIAVAGLTPGQEATWWAEQRERETWGARLGDDSDADQVARFRAGEIFVLDMTQPPYDTRPNPYGVTTALVAPMRAGESLVGMLSLDYGGPPHSFLEDEVTLAGAVAQLGAVVLERDRLLRERAQTEAHILALQEAQHAMDSFLGIAGHELKTPLTTTVATGQLAQRRLRSLTEAVRTLDARAGEVLDPLIEPLTRFMDRIGDAAQRQTRLVDDLLDVSRIRAGRLELHREWLDLRRLVADVVEEQRLHHPERAIALHLPSREVRVLADADRIGQAVTNLLTNALKYSAGTAPVDVRVRVTESGAQVRVRDHGPGIARTEQPYVWERFHRVPGVQTVSGSGVGLGLGLYITREILARHGGHVGLKSALGKGSTFWVTLPLSDQEDGR